ncbi:hypothetical protein D0C36_03775 [Mucilaginibacter conchicola]|uniref:DUF4105 domain-containing protein n=1 Tax=Mucilaginibacter conchicola TaxID=2303333 RepID=A0A372NYR9_9SPHI|nr:hypothetical protein [Mucilaginibacter conchicola]RFZ94667.1 hypothetical protein D0C36_03775 [Mucilaginibacter conchicola]
MTTSTRTPLLKALFVAAFALSSFTAKAQLSAALPYKPGHTDSLSIPSTYIDEQAFTAPKTTKIASIFDDANDKSLQQKVSVSLNNASERRQLMDYLKQLEVDDNSLTGNESKNKTLFKFANLFARLKLYPLAMKCFFKTLQKDKKHRENEESALIDTLQDDDQQAFDLPIDTKDDSLAYVQSVQVKKEKSPRTTYENISKTFNDGKQAVAYALLFHVKQPAPGKGKVHVLAYTGHTYITLIKYNTDSTYVSCSFGFYPKKDHLFSATPWFPSTSSQFKDDASHKWDEVIGKFISKRKFDRILKLTKEYNDVDYHLSYNNCTDFSLQAATVAGISVSKTEGKWFMGHGNNPGTTGQSIIHGGYSNTDGEPAATMFKSLNTSVTDKEVKIQN